MILDRFSHFYKDFTFEGLTFHLVKGTFAPLSGAFVNIYKWLAHKGGGREKDWFIVPYSRGIASIGCLRF